MAIITTLDADNTRSYFTGDKGAEIWSSSTVVANTFRLDRATSGLAIERFTHVFIGVRMYNDAGALCVDDDAGTFTVTVQTQNTGGSAGIEGLWEVPTNNEIDATDPHTVNFRGNTLGVRVVPGGTFNAAAGAVNYRVIITANLQ